MPNVYTRVHHRKDTDESWSASNPTLLDGEVILVSIDGKIRQKVGDGVTRYIDLPYMDSDVLGSLEDMITPEDTGKILGVDEDGNIALVESPKAGLSIPTTPDDAGKILGVDESGNISLVEAPDEGISIPTTPEDIGKFLGVNEDGDITLLDAPKGGIDIPVTPADAGKVLGVDENGNITLIEATIVGSGGKMTWGDLKDMTSE